MPYNEEFRSKVVKDENPFIKASCQCKYHARKIIPLKKAKIITAKKCQSPLSESLYA
jgi:hypothetical protein